MCQVPLTIERRSLLAAARVRRFLDGWRRFEDAMDYQPYDYTLDRIRALELRIEDLEQRLRAVADGSSTPPTAATLMPISQDPR